MLMRKAMSTLTALLSRSPRPLSTRRLGSSLFLFAGVREPDTSTFFPPEPSITLPVLPSTTLAWNQPPRALSRKLPRPPHIVTAMTQKIFSCHPHPSPPSNPGLLPKNFPRIVVSTEQKGIRITDVKAIMKAPTKPASVPASVTPPLVPGGTWRKFQDVRSLGLLFERMPNSEENVSAATAA